MTLTNWISSNYIELLGAVAGILYVFLEIRQNLWLWPVGIITSAVYLCVFFTGKLYADAGLQGYYLVISVIGWYWWVKGSGLRAEGTGRKEILVVSRIKQKIAIILTIVFLFLYVSMWKTLDHFTDSPVPGWDAFITSLSIIATWMLARKIFEHWYLWIIVNAVAAGLFLTRGLYPTFVLYCVYFAMSFIGLREWGKSMPHPMGG